jgi:hypothetical protein
MRITEAMIERRLKALREAGNFSDDYEHPQWIDVTGAFGGWRIEGHGYDLLDTGYVTRSTLFAAMWTYMLGIKRGKGL